MVEEVLIVCFFAAQNIPQFPPGFQAQFANAAANFANFRPQFSVPGQVSGRGWTGDVTE